MASNSNLIAMASNLDLVVMASNLIAMASNQIANSNPNPIQYSQFSGWLLVYHCDFPWPQQARHLR